MKTIEEKAEYRREYRKTHKKERKEYLLRNKEKIRQQDIEWHKKYRLTHPLPIKIRIRIKKTHSQILENRRKYESRRIKEDANFRIRRNFGNIVYMALKNKRVGTKWEKVVGYSLKELKLHLESNFRNNMTWNNYGSTWQVDHIIPRYKFDLTKTGMVKKCWALNNLQPLLTEENMAKGRKILSGTSLAFGVAISKD